MQQLVRSLAHRADVQGCACVEERIQLLHRILFGRSADQDEMKLAKQFLTADSSTEKNTNTAEGEVFSPWEEYVQTLLISNEFIFVD